MDSLPENDDSSYEESPALELLPEIQDTILRFGRMRLLKDISETPFTEDDLEWLAQQEGHLSIFFINGKYAKENTHSLSNLAHFYSTGLYYGNGVGYCIRRAGFVVPIVPIETAPPTESVILGYLIGRLGIEIKEESGIFVETKEYRGTRLNDPAGGNANRIIIDLRCLMLIFQMRYEAISTKGARSLARNTVRKMLDNTVDFLAPPRSREDDPLDSKLPVLLLYLAINARALEEEGHRGDYDGFLHSNLRFINHDYLDEVEDRCRKIYERLTELISRW